MRLGRCGFTLIECVLWIAVLGIPAALAVPTFIGYCDRLKLSQIASEDGLLLADAPFVVAIGEGACEVTPDTALKIKTNIRAQTINLEVAGLTFAKPSHPSREFCQIGTIVEVPEYVAARMAGYTINSDKTVRHGRQR